MDTETGEKSGVGLEKVKQTKPRKWVFLLLRMLVLGALVSATLVMALNKETKTLVVATIGTTPVNATLKAKFQHTPAFVFFVIANSLASLHNIVMLMVDLFGYKFDLKGLQLLIMTILDMMTVALVSAGAGAATFMAELGKNGNKHARWNKICDKFGTYCDHGGGALIASYIGLVLLMILNVLSIIALHKKTPTQSVVPGYTP